VPNDKWLVDESNDSYSKNKNINNEKENAEEDSYENYNDNDDSDDGDMVIAQCLLWGDEVGWWCRHSDAVIGYRPSEEKEEGSLR